MVIIQISDLHISCNSNIEFAKTIIEKMSNYILCRFSPQEEFAVFVMGDIADRLGVNKDAYIYAADIFNDIKEKFIELNISYDFIPGNHDLCDDDLKVFDDFIENYQSISHRFCDCSTYSKLYDGVNFIFTSSVEHREIEKGVIILDDIKRNVRNDMPNALIVHHGLLNEGQVGCDTIVDASNVIRVLKEQNFSFIMHGHAHGKSSDCLDGIQQIGVGSLLADLKDFSNYNNQFNIIEVKNKKITKIINLIFRGETLDFDPTHIYPADRIFVNPFTITRVQYPEVSDFIERKVILHRRASQDSLSEFLNEKNKLSIFEACKEHTRVLLLSEAGFGKTVFLQQFAHEINNPKFHYFPVLINLNTYLDEELFDLIPIEYRELDPSDLFLIFDGFDEIEHNNVKRFVRRMESFVQKFPDMHILVSARTNFCRSTSQTGVSRTLNGFSEFNICPLVTSDIHKYIERSGIDRNSFDSEIRSKKLNGLEYNPFYLTCLAKYYLDNRELPDRIDLMERIIKQSYILDEEKFKNAESLDERCVEITSILKKVAFSLQLLQQNYLSDEVPLSDYQNLFTKDDRDLLKYCSIWKKEDDTWQFSHNNFREFLAAQYMSDVSIDNIIKLITYPDSNKKIKTSWINTLSFLISMHHDPRLIEWLVQESPDMLIKAEDERLTSDKRFEIFVSIFSEFKEKNMWLNASIYSLEELGHFAQSDQALSFLLTEIEHPTHFRSQHNALTVLMNFDKQLFERSDEVRRILINLCGNVSFHSRERGASIFAISKLELHNDSTTEKLMELFENDYDSEIRSAMYDYLINANLQDTYVAFFLQGIEYSFLRNRDKSTDFGSLSSIIRGLESLKIGNSLRQAISWFAQVEHELLFYKSDEIFEALCRTASEIQIDGDDSLSEELAQVYIFATNRFQQNKAMAIIRYFDKIGNRKFLLDYVLEQEKVRNAYNIAEIVKNDQECIADLSSKYENDTLNDSSLFENYVACMAPDNPEFERLAQIIKTKCGKDIPKRVYIDYTKLRREGRQKYFDALFSYDEFMALFNELISVYGNPEITHEELLNSDYDLLDKRYDLDQLKFAILSMTNTTDKVSDLFLIWSWESFSCRQIYNIINESTDIEVSEQQTMHIEKYFYEILEAIDFENAISSSRNGSYTISFDLRHFTCFLKRFDFPCPETTYVEMLIIPQFLIAEGNTVYQDFSFLEKRISKHRITERIIDNIKNKDLFGEVLWSHLEYCQRHRIKGIESDAYTLCSDVNYDFSVRQKAVDYLQDIYGNEYIIDEILPIVSNDLFIDMARKLSITKSAKLESFLSKKLETEINLEYLEVLLKMSSNYGLEWYVKFAETENMIPDQHMLIPSITEALSHFDNFESLSSLLNLSSLLYKPGFKDHEHNALQNSLFKSIISIGGGENYQTVKVEIESILKTPSISDEQICFYNYVLNDMRDKYYQNFDDKWTIEKVKKYFNEQ